MEASTTAPTRTSTQAQAIAPDALLNLTSEQRRCFLLLRAALYESRTAFQMIDRDREGGNDKMSPATVFAVRQAARKSEEVNDQTVTATLYAYIAETRTERAASATAVAAVTASKRKVWTFDPAAATR